MESRCEISVQTPVIAEVAQPEMSQMHDDRIQNFAVDARRNHLFARLGNSIAGRIWISCSRRKLDFSNIPPMKTLIVLGRRSRPNWQPPPNANAAGVRQQAFSRHGRWQAFFWLGDTAWEIFHRLNREEAVKYLDNRAKKSFTVIQAVAIAEFDGNVEPNFYGNCR